MIFKKIHLLFFLGILTTQIAGYSNEYAPTGYCRTPQMYNQCCAPLGLGITFIYFQPAIEDTAYVLSSSENLFNGSHYPNGKRHQNTTSFSPGFRVEGMYITCPKISFFDLRFTYLTTHSTDSVSGPFLYDTNGFPGFGAQDSPLYEGRAQSKNRFNYYAGDLDYNRNFSCFFPENFRFIVGLHTAYIKFREHTSSRGSFFDSDSEETKSLVNDLNRFSQFWGIGPQFGLSYRYLLPCGCPGTFALKAKTRAALLSGYSKSDLRYVTLRTGPVGVAVHNGHPWRIIPTVSADLGISYNLNCNCFKTTLELGYEFTWYSNCINKVTGLETAFAGDSIDYFNNFSLQGPYLSLNFLF